MRKITIVIVCLMLLTTFSYIFPMEKAKAAPPYTPSNPFPHNDSENIAIDVNLSWTGGDPDGDDVTYDVYFGENSSPPLEQNNVTISKYDFPDLLERNTKYYWYIVAWDLNGSTQGPLWNFGTGSQPNNPPNIPTNPSPADGSVGISIDADLNWTGGDPDDDNVTYDVYFGESSSPPKKASNITDDTYSPGTMSNGTIYYWKIIAWDIYNTSREGPLWNFQTNRLPNQPSTPSPANGSSDVSINAVLSWSGGDPDPGDTVTYDVYFGTTSTPGQVSYNQPGLSYDPGTLAFNTSYYWRIVAWDDHDALKIGPLWNFTTGMQSNQPPYEPNTPTPLDGFLGASIDVNLSWIGGDPDGDPVTYDVYFGTSSPPPKVASNLSTTFSDPGTMQYETLYYWKIVAWDNQSSSSGPIWNFTTASEQNLPPYIPTSPSPKNGSTGVSVNADLSWTGGDPNPGDTVTYDVYFGPTSSPPKKVTNQTTTSYDPGTMSYSTMYYWKIIAWDSYSNSTSSVLFRFTTAAQSGGGQEPPEEPQNIKPIADASAGEPYRGGINTSILFDGSKSYDPDGNITKWVWVFGDNKNDIGMTVYHSFSEAGTYSVTLTVTDDKGATNSDTTACVISSDNHPPSIPTIDGPRQGTKNTQYTYTVVSTDTDNDMLQYTFEWDGSISQSSGFLSSGVTYSVNHSWTSAGRYNLTVIVSDNKTQSSSKIIVYIDAVQARGAGYLLDNDGDGIYDAFFSDETHRIMSIERNDGSYLIDKDGDGTWDYVYNETLGLTSYQEPRKTPGFELVVVLGAFAVALVLWRKKRIV